METVSLIKSHHLHNILIFFLVIQNEKMDKTIIENFKYLGFKLKTEIVFFLEYSLNHMEQTRGKAKIFVIGYHPKS